MLFFSAGTASLPVAVLCGAFALQLLIAGDTALRALMPPMIQSWAAGGWMIAGALLGASYGTLRRLDDVFSARLLSVLLGWLIVLTVIYGFLLGASMTAGSAVR
jgi:hypothetical protein